jgi:hypothetical protein
VVAEKLPLILSKPPPKWNVHDFISKIIVQQIGDLDVGCHATRAVLNNETGRSDLMMAFQHTDAHSRATSSSNSALPVKPHKPQHQQVPSTTEEFARSLRQAATGEGVVPKNCSTVAVVELKYSNVTKHDQHWRHGLRVNRSHSGPALADAHFIIAILDPRKSLNLTVDYANLNSLRHLTFLLSCSAVAFLADVSLAVTETGELRSADYIGKKGFVAFKINSTSEGELFLADAFHPHQRFSLKKALAYCHTTYDLDQPRPTLLGPNQWCCPGCGVVLSSKPKIRAHSQSCISEDTTQPTKRRKLTHSGANSETRSSM